MALIKNLQRVARYPKLAQWCVLVPKSFIVIIEGVLCTSSGRPRVLLRSSLGAGLRRRQRSDHRTLIDAQVQIGCRAQVRMPENLLRDLDVASGFEYALRERVTESSPATLWTVARLLRPASLKKVSENVRG